MAYQRNDLASKRGAGIAFVSNLLKIIVLLTMHNYYAYVLVIPLATILTNLANAVLANRMFPDVVCRGSISQEMKDALKKRIVGLLSFKIYNVIFTSVDAIVISAFLGLTPLAVYNNYYYVQSSVVGFLAILTSSITAGIGNKMVTNSRDENYRDFKNLVFVNGWISSWCAVCMFVLYQHFMRLWMGEDVMFPFSTMTLMVLYFLLPRLTTMSYTYREAAGLWWEDRFRPLIATAVNLTANILLVQCIGMNGVIISTLICTIFINVPWGSIILFKYYFRRRPTEYFGQLIYYVLVTAAAGGITYIICCRLPGEGIVFLIVKGMVCCVIPNIIFWLGYHRMTEYQYMKILVKRALEKIFPIGNMKENIKEG